MIFKILPGSSTFHGVDYNEKKLSKGTAELLHFDGFGHYQLGKQRLSAKEYKEYLSLYSGRNGRVQKPQFHAMLSCKGNEHTHWELKETALKVMEGLGYSDSPMLIYGHSDTKNNHVHIISSRVGLDGRKIAHDLEGKRAYKILNEVLGKDTKLDFGQHLEDALGYNFGNVAQFQLLMERLGHTVREKDGNLLFYRYGTEQGRIAKNKVEQKATENGRLFKKPEQLKAIMLKYSGQYGTLIEKHIPPKHSSEKPKFSSELTDFLKEKFGHEFVFFSGKEKDRPYGYAVIDHRNRTVFKGSEIMDMQVLENLGNNNRMTRQQQPWQNIGDNRLEKQAGDQTSGMDVEQTVEKDLPSKETASLIGNLLDLIGDTSKGTTIQSGAGEAQIKKKKKRRFF